MKLLIYLFVFLLPLPLYAWHVSLQLGTNYLDYAEYSQNYLEKYNTETGFMPNIGGKIQQRIGRLCLGLAADDSYGNLLYTYVPNDSISASTNPHNIFNANLFAQIAFNHYFSSIAKVGFRNWDRDIHGNTHEIYKNHYWLIGPAVSIPIYKKHILKINVLFGKTFDVSVIAGQDSNIYLPHTKLGNKTMMQINLDYFFYKNKYFLYSQYEKFGFGYSNGLLGGEPNSRTQNYKLGLGVTF